VELAVRCTTNPIRIGELLLRLSLWMLRIVRLILHQLLGKALRIVTVPRTHNSRSLNVSLLLLTESMSDRATQAQAAVCSGQTHCRPTAVAPCSGRIRELRNQTDHFAFAAGRLLHPTRSVVLGSSQRRIEE
jgi:hypothetical protein